MTLSYTNADMKPNLRQYSESPFNRQQQDTVFAVGPLPILEETRTRLHARLRDRQITFNDLAPEVERDPALCLQLQRLAVEQNPDCLEQISGAANCLSLLGMQELVRLVKQLPVITTDTLDEGEQAYRTALQNAALAGRLAALWTQQKGNISPHYAHWATMLAAAPLWPWLLSVPPARNWLYYLSLGLEPWQALQAIWGKDLKPWQRLVTHMHLPPLAREVWNPRKHPTPQQWQALRRCDPRDLPAQTGRPLIHLGQQPVMTTLLCCHLAWHLHIHPRSQRSTRWLTLISHWLGKPESMVTNQLRETLLDVSHQQGSAFATGLHQLLHTSAHDHPAAGIQYPWVETRPAPAVATPVAATPDMSTPDMSTPDMSTPAASAIPATSNPRPTPHLPPSPSPSSSPSSSSSSSSSPAPSPSSSAAVPAQAAAAAPVARSARHNLAALQQRMQQDARSFGDWHSLVSSLLHGIRLGLSVPFAALWLPNRDKTCLRLIYQEGIPEQQPIVGLQLPLDKTSLFSKLMERNAGISLHPGNRQQLLRGIPPVLAQQLPDHAMLMSISAGAKPIGIVMAGTLDSNQLAISASDYPHFKSLCHYASQGLACLREQSLEQQKSARHKT